MNTIGNSTWLWLGFIALIIFMLSLDLGLFNRKAHTIRYREAGIWSSIWVALAAVFAGDPALSDVLISGTFEVGDGTSVVAALQALLPVEAIKKGEQEVLLRPR